MPHVEDFVDACAKQGKQVKVPKAWPASSKQSHKRKLEAPSQTPACSSEGLVSVAQQKDEVYNLMHIWVDTGHDRETQSRFRDSWGCGGCSL